MHIIKVCVGCSCAQKFALDNLAKAEKILGIKAGETTPDGKFRLEKSGCMANCEKAPNVMFCKADGPLSMLMIDGKIEENLLPNRFEKMLKELKNS